MASLVLSGDTSGSVTLAAPAVAGSTTQTLVNVTGTLAPVVSGTAVSASGTSVDFTDIPSWVKRITVMFSGVSTNGTSNLLFQLGDSGGVETTGYVTGYTTFSASALTSGTETSGFRLLPGASAAAQTLSGTIVFAYMGSNLWVGSGNMSRTDSGSSGICNGSKTLSNTLDRVRIATFNGTDTFDAGTINILYE
jgi:hypothetical protein